MTNKTDWIVHYVSNNVYCDEYGKREDSFLPCLCNAHTHGMKKYNHLDFQIVLDLGAQEVCRILNELGRRVRAGHRFTAGEMIPGVYEDCDVRLDIAEETGREGQTEGSRRTKGLREPFLTKCFQIKGEKEYENHIPQSGAEIFQLQSRSGRGN